TDVGELRLAGEKLNVSDKPAGQDSFALDHLRHICARFCIVARQQRSILYDVKTRAANMLLAYADAFPRPSDEGLRIGVPLTQADLASDLGVNLRSVNRAFTEWRQNKWVVLHKGWIVLSDRRAIERQVEGLENTILYPTEFPEAFKNGRDYWAESGTRCAPPEKAREKIRENPVFSGASDDALGELLHDAHWLEVDPGTRTIEPGQASSFVDLLIEGRMRVFHATDSERKVTVKHLGAPCTLGEMQALTGLAYFQFAEALTRCLLVRVRADALVHFLEANSAATQGLLRDVARRLYLAYRNEASILANVTGRVASLLLAYAEAFGRESADGVVIRYPLTQKIVAQETGATTKSINRAFSAWRDAGVVDTHKGWFLLRRIGEIEAASGGLRFNLKYEAREEPPTEERL
ncbi:MAG: Crp/Fnr family transcriptional regulator, partial [Myxococcota bacterium]